MRYCIFTLGSPRRKHYVDAIEDSLQSWKRIPVWTVNGASGEVPQFVKHHGISPSQSFPFRVGQLGVWYSVINALTSVANEPVVTFEDDSILSEAFAERFKGIWENVPQDADFLSLFMPERWRDSYYRGRILNSRGDILPAIGYYPEGNPAFLTGHRSIAKAYQPNGGVSMVYTPHGAKRILSLLRRTGLTEQYDDYLYRQSRLGNLNGYTVAPTEPDMVSVNESEPTTIHNSLIYN